MSGRLDQSLDSIIDSQKKAKRDAQRRRKSVKTSGAGAVAPVGGIKKSTKPVKPAIKPAAGSAAQPKSSKIVVSGLVSYDLILLFFIPDLLQPIDVNEAQIKVCWWRGSKPWISSIIQLSHLRCFCFFDIPPGPATVLDKPLTKDRKRTW